MIKFLKKYTILIILVILIIILVFLKIFYGNTDKNNNVSIPVVITPTEIPTPTSFENEGEYIIPNEDYVSVLPYLGKKMKIVGIKTPGVLEIMIENEIDKDEAIKEIELWKIKYPTFEEYTFDFTIRKLN